MAKRYLESGSSEAMRDWTVREWREFFHPGRKVVYITPRHRAIQAVVDDGGGRIEYIWWDDYVKDYRVNVKVTEADGYTYTASPTIAELGIVECDEPSTTQDTQPAY